MRLKTIAIIVITILLTIVLMQNTSEVLFKFLFASFYISKLTMLLFIGIVCFGLGVLVGRPKPTRFIPGTDNGHEADKPLTDDNGQKNKNNTLSDEDRDFLS